MSESPGLVQSLVGSLNARGVKYIVVGGAAMELHGSAYKTQDVDIVYKRDATNVGLMVDALAAFHPRLRVEGGDGPLPFVWSARTVLNGSNFTLDTDMGPVDILATVSGGYTYETLADMALRFEVGGLVVPMLTLEGLATTKRAAGRPKDMLALPELEAMIEVRRERERDLGGFR